MSITAASTQLVQKLWNYCNILRDDGLSYGDYVEQLTIEEMGFGSSLFTYRFADVEALDR